jgi:hypothetical protein
LLWISKLNPECFPDFSAEGPRNFPNKKDILNVEFWFNQAVKSFENNRSPAGLALCRSCTNVLDFSLFGNIMVFHFNILEIDIIFSAGLCLIPSFRVREWNTGDKINWTWSMVYKFSLNWVSALLGKLSAHSLNWVICFLNRLTYLCKSTEVTSRTFSSPSSLWC